MRMLGKDNIHFGLLFSGGKKQFPLQTETQENTLNWKRSEDTATKCHSQHKNLLSRMADSGSDWSFCIWKQTND